jgi:hypothetical protein
MTQVTHTCTRAPHLQQYAPYWYVDKLTDSIVEVKNHLASTLMLPFEVSAGQGPDELGIIVIPPHATTRTSLKGFSTVLQLMAQKSAIVAQNLWGDASRPNSAFGVAVLINRGAPEFKSRILCRVDAH